MKHSFAAHRPRVLDVLSLPDFSPLPGLGTGSMQTIAGAYWPHRADLNGTLRRVPLGEGDATLAMINRPRAWDPGDRVAVLVHGLVGDHNSNYMVRLARRLYDECYLVVRVNLRNAGPAFGLSRKTYHGGITDDIRAVLNWIGTEYPGSDVAAFGFSLGGNLLLKTAAEDGPRVAPCLRTIATVSPAVDLKVASERLEKLPGRFFARVFMSYMMHDLKRLNALFPDDLKPLPLPPRPTIRQFDEVHISSYHDYKDAEEYYAKSSSLHNLENICIPTLILGAEDDPVIDVTGVLEKKLPTNIETIITRYGGHVGYLGRGNGGTSLRWSDDVLMRWLDLRWGKVATPRPALAPTASPIRRATDPGPDPGIQIA